MTTEVKLLLKNSVKYDMYIYYSLLFFWDKYFTYIFIWIGGFYS